MGEGDSAPNQLLISAEQSVNVFNNSFNEETPAADDTKQGNPVRHNPDIPETFIATNNIDLLRTAGNRLEAELMKLHRYHHGPTCETCQALDTWWTVNGR